MNREAILAELSMNVMPQWSLSHHFKYGLVNADEETAQNYGV